MTTTNSMTDAELTATVRDHADRQIAAAFNGSAVAASAPVPVASLIERFSNHFTYDLDHDRVQAFDSPTGTKNRAPVMASGKPASFDAALAALIAEDPELAELATFANSSGVARIALAWGTRQDASPPVQDVTPAAPLLDTATVPLRDAATSRIAAAIAAGRGPRRVGLFD